MEYLFPWHFLIKPRTVHIHKEKCCINLSQVISYGRNKVRIRLGAIFHCLDETFISIPEKITRFARHLHRLIATTAIREIALVPRRSRIREVRFGRPEPASVNRVDPQRWEERVSLTPVFR